jgi:hypothetical protein
MEPVERRTTGVEIRTFPRLSCQSSENFHSLRVFAFDGASFSKYGRAESHSAEQRIPRSHSSASLTSRSASALSFVARASLRYRTARGPLMDFPDATCQGFKYRRNFWFLPNCRCLEQIRRLSILLGMEELNPRSLERMCRAQAALTTHEPTKRSSWKRWQRNIGARPISKIRQQAQE